MSDQLPAELADLIAADTLDAPTPVDTATKATLEGLVSEMLDLKSNVDELEALLKTTKEQYDGLRKRRLPDLMQELGLVGPDGKGGFTHSSGASIYLKVDVYAYCKKEYEPAFFAWLRANGHGDIIRETVHPSTLKAFAKERVQDGEPLPPQLTVTPETTAVLKQPKQTGDEA